MNSITVGYYNKQNNYIINLPAFCSERQTSPEFTSFVFESENTSYIENFTCCFNYNYLLNKHTNIH